VRSRAFSPRTWRRALLSLTVALFVPLLLAACAEPPTIVVWHAYRGDEESALVELAKRYEQERGIHVELLALPFDAYSAKLAAAVPRAHGPDLFIDAHERLGIYRQQGVVAPAGDAFPAEDVPRYDATAVRAITLDGQRWGVPLASKCVALYVNDALLAAPVESTDELVRLRPALPDGSYPLAYEAENPYYQAAVLSGFGGRLLEDDGRYGFVGPAAEQSILFVKELTATRIIPAEPSGGLVKQLFASGRAATAIDGPWLAADIAGGVRFHVQPLPAIGATGRVMTPPLTVEAVMLSPLGAGKPEARAFARWLGGDASAIERAITAHQVVATTAAWADPRVAQDALLGAFHEAAARAEPMPTSTRMRAAWVPVQSAMRRVLRGEPPSIALPEGERRFEDALRPAPPPPSPAPLVLVLGLLALAGAFAAVRRARTPEFRAQLRESTAAYRYVAHAAVVVFVLVVLPLVAGALTSFFSGTASDPQYVGLGNYVAILTARGGPIFGHESFYLTLAVTVLWTVANVALHLGIGVVLGVVLSRPAMKLRAAYRVLLVLPWAVPSYVTALAWKGMFHRQFGAINAILAWLGAEPVSWFSHFSTAFAANVATNTWLGFPFMMVVTLGALTSISKDVMEAAEVDGASRWQRFWKVTVPLLRPSMLPAVILGTVWTFNMFNVVFLVSGGEPDGTTDILVSDAYRWAFTRDAQYGYAAAYGVIIFAVLAGGSRMLGRLGSGPAARVKKRGTAAPATTDAAPGVP
jgi:arabinogalactan oligomer / maltooligosaccharide transport system permease protein